MMIVILTTRKADSVSVGIPSDCIAAPTLVTWSVFYELAAQVFLYSGKLFFEK